MRAVALALAALALTACESSQEENAKIEKVYRREAAEAAKRRAAAERALSIPHPSRVVKVLAATALHTSEAGAAVVTLQNTSARTLRDLPIEITVKDAADATIYTNATPGLARALVTVPLLAAHATSLWVEDQVQTTAAPASVEAKVGEGETIAQAPPQDAVTDARLVEGVAEGSLDNRSHSSQSEVILYAVARRGGQIVAAGSALVPTVEAGASAHFQAALVGNARGAQLEVSVGGSV